jgi:hypothetical protein
MWYLEPNQRTKLVYVPKWMFILFGAPKHKSVPTTVQPAWSVYLQVMGITMAIYGIFLDQRLVKNPDLSALLGFGISMFLGIVISRWLILWRPYTWQNNMTVDEKT